MRVPKNTYRLQLNKTFQIDDVLSISDYLKKLGVSDLYFSPILQPVPGSMHGYDVIDTTSLNSEIGTIDRLKILSNHLKQNDMGILLDIVPNHMAFHYLNIYLIDIFENDTYSRYYNFFDINWNHTFKSINGKLITPFLGKFYGECLDNGELSINYNEFGFHVQYYENRFCLKIDTYYDILVYKQFKLQNQLGKDHPDYIKYLGLLYIIKNLSSEEDDFKDRYVQVRFIKAVLWELYSNCEIFKSFLDENIFEINGTKGNSESFNTLDKILSKQVFRLTYWKVATDEINYRRFFNVNGLISVQIEKDEVFNKVHSYILELMTNGIVDGLRIDHIDGLSYPAEYLQRLKSRTNNSYIIVEKILESKEDLPENWDCEGTSGYDYLNYQNGLFIRKSNAKPLLKIYRTFTNEEWNYKELLYEKKRIILTRHMSGDMDNIAQLVKKIASDDRYASDYTFVGLKMALEEIIILFPIYRTYISNDNISQSDRKVIVQTIQLAKKLNPSLIYELNFIENLLLLKYLNNKKEQLRSEMIMFIIKFQQYTGPLMAKGLEDTLFYSYNNFISLNEVGGDPGRFAITTHEFHKFNSHRAKRFPYTLNTSSTHDTKRGEDVRARLNVISEIPAIWNKNIKDWNKLNKKFKSKSKGLEFPDRNDEYFIYQTLLGSFPFNFNNELYHSRIKEYSIKAVRESKNHTNWLKPDAAYEDRILKFIENILDDSNGFLDKFKVFARYIAFNGMLNSLSQVILKILSPGIPDIYQGTELWDLTLVDPDNRREIDFNIRNEYLDIVKKVIENKNVMSMKELFDDFYDGKIKLYFTYNALQVRNTHYDIFKDGDYIPLTVKGDNKEIIISFLRTDKAKQSKVIVIISRFHTSITPLQANCENISLNFTERAKKVLENTIIEIPNFAQGEYTDSLTGQTVTIESDFRISDFLTLTTHAILISSG